MRQIFWLCLSSLVMSGCTLVIDAGESPLSATDMGDTGGVDADGGGDGDASPDGGPDSGADAARQAGPDCPETGDRCPAICEWLVECAVNTGLCPGFRMNNVEDIARVRDACSNTCGGLANGGADLCEHTTCQETIDEAMGSLDSFREACSTPVADAGMDATVEDGGPLDGGLDAGDMTVSMDAGDMTVSMDAGDMAVMDSGRRDGGLDAGVEDAEPQRQDAGDAPGPLVEGPSVCAQACGHLSNCLGEASFSALFVSLEICTHNCAYRPLRIGACIAESECGDMLDDYADCFNLPESTPCVGDAVDQPPCNGCPVETVVPEGVACVPAGQFTMGSEPDEAGHRDVEAPRHRVTITRPFLMELMPVSQQQWGERVQMNPSANDGRGAPCLQCPVERMTWFEAMSYANLRSRSEGLPECYAPANCMGQLGEGLLCLEPVAFEGLDCTGYRLPTEAEYEYATRAGTTTRFWNGSADEDLDAIAWHRDNSAVDGANQTRGAGLLHPNPWGFYDVHGNVSEWVHDGRRVYGPEDETDPIGPADGVRRLRKGGGYLSVARLLRSGDRSSQLPPESAEGVTGFRLVRTLPPADPVVSCGRFRGCRDRCVGDVECTAECEASFPRGSALDNAFTTCARRFDCEGNAGIDEACARANCAQEVDACFVPCPAPARCNSRQVEVCSFGSFSAGEGCTRGQRCLNGACEALPQEYGLECLGIGEAGLCVGSGLVCSVGVSAANEDDLVLCRHPTTAQEGPGARGAECYGPLDCRPGLLCTLGGLCSNGRDGAACLDNDDCVGECVRNLCVTR